MTQSNGESTSDRPLGETLPSRSLERSVLSCKEAAAAKNVPLENELKTLVLQTSDGLYAVHLRGNRRLSLRAVKNFLRTKEAYLLPAPKMESLGLTPGKACPFLPPIWTMRQLVTSELLKLQFTTTNNGTLNGYFVFPPDLLLKVPQIAIGEFEETTSGDLTDEVQP